ncbi:hypothetical protein [Microbacterium paraoxydans]|uniref:hypothetical protein n=1 Tax=Microbacterium paraoxydans TaxID=199592 RepID=UPI001CF9E04D|nr:hypothetical protein [Microbacterium paraoxydans]
MRDAVGPWICDACGQEIADPGEGLFTWTYGELVSGFSIVHMGRCDRELDPTHDKLSAGLREVLGPDGQAMLLGLLSKGPVFAPEPRRVPIDLDAFVDVFRRLQSPGYEAARPYFGTVAADDDRDQGTGYLPYTQRRLEAIASEGLRLAAD